ncbi:unnamed protein product [Cylindrotheca closterium]|uniref:Uncharacterized protein n=1 Tax=Cylindrotheca closterium TaxID=2856 RepID=A0AAD2PVH2_9STRA|nr:unnamed protein product [Cylindrotheca closterium]
MNRTPQAQALSEFDKFISEDLPRFLTFVAKEVMFPLITLLICFGGAVKLFAHTQQQLYPPPKSVRHKEIVKQYSNGKVDEALQEFAKLDYGPSYLSMACHEIYVVGTEASVAKGIMILKEAQIQNKGIPEKKIKEMRADAAAILSGNAIMVRTNANVAKEEYLGVASW